MKNNISFYKDKDSNKYIVARTIKFDPKDQICSFELKPMNCYINKELLGKIASITEEN